MTIVDVIAPAHNEEAAVGAMLRSIAEQKLPADMVLNVLVVANGCTDDTAAVARKAIAKFGRRPKMNFEVVESSDLGKNKALNLGLKRSSAELVVCVDADVTFSSDCFAKVLGSLADSQILVSGAQPESVVDEALAKTLLGQFYQVRRIKREVVGGRLMPMGRMTAFRRNVVGPYREDFVGAQDTWLPLEVAYRFGWQAVAVVHEAKVWAIPPQNWLDLMRQESRWELNTARLLAHFPELMPAWDELAGRILVEQLMTTKRRAEVLKRMEAANIAAEVLELNEQLMPTILRENAGLMGTRLARSDGHWEAVGSTKSRV